MKNLVFPEWLAREVERLEYEWAKRELAGREALAKLSQEEYTAPFKVGTVIRIQPPVRYRA